MFDIINSLIHTSSVTHPPLRNTPQKGPSVHTNTNTYQDGHTYLLFLLVFRVVEEAKIAYTKKDASRCWLQVMSPQ